jgi:hypothetical protein
VTLLPRGLLIEEQRTNLALRSEEFDNVYWTKTSTTLTANATVSPTGATTADKIVSSAATAQMSIDSSAIAVTSGVNYTWSVFFKAGEYTFAQLRFNNAAFSGAEYATFNLSNGTISQSTGSGHSITAVGNGWYRCVIIGAATATTNAVPAITLATSGTGGRNPTITGDGTSGIFAFGAQLEAGAFATSYIPTIASTVTRSADVAAITGSLFSQWWNNPTGTLIVDYQQQAAVSGDVAMTSDGTPLTNSLGIYGSSTNDVGWCRTGGVNQALISIAATITNPHKAAFAYATNDFALSSIGGAVSTDTSGTIPTVNQIRFGVQISGGQAMWLRSFRYVPVRAADFQLQQVTT